MFSELRLFVLTLVVVITFLLSNLPLDREILTVRGYWISNVRAAESEGEEAEEDEEDEEENEDGEEAELDEEIEEVTGRLEEIEEEFRLILFRGNQSHHLLTKTFCDLLGFDVSNKSVLVRLTN